MRLLVSSTRISFRPATHKQTSRSVLHLTNCCAEALLIDAPVDGGMHAMITRQAAAFALSTVFLVCSILAIPGRGRTGGVSDPCKLLSEKEIHDTLGVASPVLLEPSSWSPEWTVHLVDAG